MLKLFTKCPRCNTSHFISFLKHHKYVCSKCNFYFRLNPQTRIKMLCDRGSFKEINKGMKSLDPLNFPNYKDKLHKAIKSTKQNESVMTGVCKINGFTTTLAVLNPMFMMGSMGSVTGEKITRMLEYSIDLNIPAVIITASGGARMQEGILSLMQMTKTSAAVKKLNNEGLPLFTVLTDPTTGGVSASFAMLGNVIIAEPNSLIGFAGPRVIKQTIGQELPDNFQKSEYLLKHGMIDMVIKRKNLKTTLGRILKIHSTRAYKKIRD